MRYIAHDTRTDATVRSGSKSRAMTAAIAIAQRGRVAHVYCIEDGPPGRTGEQVGQITVSPDRRGVATMTEGRTE